MCTPLVAGGGAAAGPAPQWAFRSRRGPTETTWFNCRLRTRQLSERRHEMSSERQRFLSVSAASCFITLVFIMLALNTTGRLHPGHIVSVFSSVVVLYFPLWSIVSLRMPETLAKCRFLIKGHYCHFLHFPHAYQSESQTAAPDLTAPRWVFVLMTWIFNGTPLFISAAALLWDGYSPRPSQTQTSATPSAAAVLLVLSKVKFIYTELSTKKELYSKMSDKIHINHKETPVFNTWNETLKTNAGQREKCLITLL